MSSTAPWLPAVHEGGWRGWSVGGILLCWEEWWKRCFSYLLECSLLNAYVLHGLAYLHLHQANGWQKFDFLQFWLEVATGFINCYCSRQRAPNQGCNCLTRRHIWHGHWPKKWKTSVTVLCAWKYKKVKTYEEQKPDTRHEINVLIVRCTFALKKTKIVLPSTTLSKNTGKTD